MKRSGGRKCAGGISDEGQGLGNAQLRAATAALYFILLNMMTHAASARNCKLQTTMAREPRGVCHLPALRTLAVKEAGRRHGSHVQFCQGSRTLDDEQEADQRIRQTSPDLCPAVGNTPVPLP